MCSLNVKVQAVLEDIKGETPEQICNSATKGPYRPAMEDEDELQLIIAQHWLDVKKAQSTHLEDRKTLNLLGRLLEITNNPPLRYDFTMYEEKWKDLKVTKNIENSEETKKAYFRKLKLEQKFSYLRNVFNSFEFKNYVVLFSVTHDDCDIFDACVREHIKQKHNPEDCKLKDVAFYELEAEVFGLDKIYNFLMQPAISCQTELEACNHFISTLVPQ